MSTEYQESIYKVFGKCPVSIRNGFRKYWESVLYVSGKDLYSVRKVSSKYQEGSYKVFGKCPVSTRKVFTKYSGSVQ